MACSYCGEAGHYKPTCRTFQCASEGDREVIDALFVPDTHIADSPALTIAPEGVASSGDFTIERNVWLNQFSNNISLNIDRMILDDIRAMSNISVSPEHARDARLEQTEREEEARNPSPIRPALRTFINDWI